MTIRPPQAPRTPGSGIRPPGVRTPASAGVVPAPPSPITEGPPPARPADEVETITPATEAPPAALRTVDRSGIPELPVPKLPAELVLKDLLAGILGRDVTLTRKATTDRSGYTGICHDESGRPVTAMRMDLPLAAATGAALGMLPAARAEEWVADGALDEDAVENASEVLNVLTLGFNKADEGRRVRLDRVYQPAEMLPPDALAVVDAPPAAVGFDVDIEGYGGGTLSVFAY